MPRRAAAVLGAHSDRKPYQSTWAQFPRHELSLETFLRRSSLIFFSLSLGQGSIPVWETGWNFFLALLKVF